MKMFVPSCRFGLACLVLFALLLAAPAARGQTAKQGVAAETDAAKAPEYELDVLPIFRAKCSQCHRGEKRTAELSLLTPRDALKGGESGPAITPGKPEESLLYELIRDGEMPPDDAKTKLTAAEIETIRRWIEGGARFRAAAPSDTGKSEDALTEHDLIPILLLRCAACHGGRRQEGELDLRTRESLLAGGKSGPAIIPGQAEESLLLKRIRAGEMPPRRRLVEVSVKPMTSSEMEMVARWIAQGAPPSPASIATDGASDDPLISEADRQFWSFQAPQAAAPPNVRDERAVRNPIDAFILHRLEAEGLSLAREADRVTLLRRACLDLTGLPPAPEDVRSFLADEDPNAFERLIDRLLASPRYGERWGRIWLDLAGYSDSEGIQNNDPVRPFAYRYRDYVIRAFNTDKPYDRFLLEQLAGDELEDYENAAEITQELCDNLVATGFLRMTADGTFANITNFVPDRKKVIDDQIEILGSAIMGLTLKCARCHSHKFDPLPQRDYYRLTAIFKGALDEHDWLVPRRQAGAPGERDRYLPYVTSREQAAWRARGKDEKSPQPLIRALWDRGEPSPTYILQRGNYLTPARPVRPDVPRVLKTTDAALAVQAPWSGAKQTGRRLAFARWLVKPDHPLTARVMVNRVWQGHFAAGLVPSLDNFGKSGTPPTHPELLDYLAVEFVRQGWSIKALHRLMMTSATYRQSSQITPAAQRLDPDNRLLSRMPLRRMDAETLRDSLLAMAERLDLTAYGPPQGVTSRADGLVVTAADKQGWRRSVYVLQRRTQIPTLLENFDLPRMNPNCVSRPQSTVAPQALHLMNNRLIHDLAGAMAQRVRRETGPDRPRQIEFAWLLAVGRKPTAAERDAASSLLDEITERWIEEGEESGRALVATKHLWLRELEPERVFEDDLISVWSSKAGDHARRYGLIEFDLSGWDGAPIKAAHLELGVMNGTPIQMSAAMIPAGIEGLNWKQYMEQKHARAEPCPSLGRVALDSGHALVGQYVRSQAASPDELQVLRRRAAGKERLALVLMADEDGSLYQQDWDDGAYSKTRHLPPRLVIRSGRMSRAAAADRALQNLCHALMNSASLLYID